MMYDPLMTQHMRAELTSLGVEELTTAPQVDAFLSRPGTALLFFNSVCGCAAGSARPGLGQFLAEPDRPEHLGTVFAGMDLEATSHVRARFAQYAPSSPAVLLLRDGEPVRYIHRTEIEGRDASAFAGLLRQAHAGLPG
ncbi:MAG: BrxA/BrxB family bacilliredoxin [bacterium]|nr:BrxA/BrxB family bacilliredoxin [bacterium]MBK9305287.1 BrxA/BrxB family bacilliredoxin [bacterium]